MLQKKNTQWSNLSLIWNFSFPSVMYLNHVNTFRIVHILLYIMHKYLYGKYIHTQELPYIRHFRMIYRISMKSQSAKQQVFIQLLTHIPKCIHAVLMLIKRERSNWCNGCAVSPASTNINAESGRKSLLSQTVSGKDKAYISNGGD